MNGVQIKAKRFFHDTAARLAQAARLPVGVVSRDDMPLGHPASSASDYDMIEKTHELPPSQPNDFVTNPTAPSGSTPHTKMQDRGRSADMTASVDILADQMLTLVEIVSAQEKDIKALKDQCRKLEEHDQAIMVAFTTFFHVLAAGRVAKIEDISGILRMITRIAEQEGRPRESVRFLQDLAAMLADQTNAAEPPQPRTSSTNE
jgi:hypothetical protein